MKKKEGAFDEYKRLLGYVKPYTGAFIFAAICMLVVSATSGVAALLIQPLLDDIFINQDRAMLAVIPLALIGIYLLRGLGRYTASSLMLKIGQQTVRDVRNELYRHIQTLSLSFFQRQTTGRLLSRIINDIQLIQESISVVIYNIFREGFTAVVLLGVLFYRDAKLATIAVIVIPFSALLISYLGRALRSKVTRVQETMADLTSLMLEALSGYRIVQAFGMQKYEMERFKKSNESFFQAMLKTIKIAEIASPLMEFVGAFGIAAIVWYGGMQVIEGKTTVGNFFSFMTALFMLFPVISRLSRVYNKIQQASAAASRVFEIIDLEPEISDAQNAKPVERLRGEVRFDNVCFSYDTEPVLKDIDLSVKAGSIIAIVGTSGAGKSTLVDLIPRFYDPTKGRILFDGTDIRGATLETLRGQTGIVTQEIFLFNDSIKNNIAYGKQETPMEKIVDAANAAYAHEFISEMPQGYDSVIGERGVMLSGGQRQRISIARAILKDPAILILDEATSALDTESEIMVQKALTNLMKGRTTFVIAHRLSTILHANRIIVLDRGEIVEEGTHHELLRKGGVYKNVYNLQFGETGVRIEE